jgi:hypothetical protein
MKINPNKSKVLNFMRSRVKDPLNCYLGARRFQKLAPTNIWELSYSDLSWADQVNDMIQMPGGHYIP